MIRSSSGPILGYLPYKLGVRNIANFSIDEFQWPMEINNSPPHLKGKSIRDLSSKDHVLIQFPKKSLYLFSKNNIQAHISLYLSEPDVLSREHFRILRFTAHKFFRILTINTELLKSKKNARFFVPAFSSITHPIKDSNKSNMVSLIASDKNSLIGHKLCHKVVEEIRKNEFKVDIMGRKYRPIKDTSEGLSRYLFSVVIENSKQSSYFSEKLIDALICETIPIYWGAPNIGDFFHEEGIIQCSSLSEIMSALNSINLEDYLKRKEFLKKNKLIAQNEYSSFDRPIQFLSREINDNQ